MIPYGRQFIDEEDISAVVDILRSAYLTTGPKVEEFEAAVASFIGTSHAVAVSSGTAALHAAVHALGIKPGDEIILPAITFAATANCIVYLRGTPVFADVDPDTLLIDPRDVEAKITSRTRAIIAVDYAGQPADYNILRRVADRHGVDVVADACHSLGARYCNGSVGTLAKLNAFSFHAVKPITTGEGGMITTDDGQLAARMRVFRNHGITTDHRQREAGLLVLRDGRSRVQLRITDFQCALGLAQLKKLPSFIDRRREIARQYDQAFKTVAGVTPLSVQKDVFHTYHLYVIRVERRAKERDSVLASLRLDGIGAGVHYIPVHLHPFYRINFGTRSGMCPVAESAYTTVLSLPIYPALTDEQIGYVIGAVKKALR